jgi:putative ABC transport system permease protein
VLGKLAQLLRLALSDLARDWALSLCQIFSLAAVLTPILVLFGLQQGVLGKLMGDLRDNPAMREIVPRVTGTNRFTVDWLAALRDRPDVAFAVGDARTLAAEVEIGPEGGDRESALAVLMATAENDPLRAGGANGWVAGRDQVVLSFGAARAIGAAPGQRIAIAVPRRRDGVDETQILATTVAAILPPERMAETRRAVLASDAVIEDVQRFRDGFAVPALGWPGEPAPEGPPRFERFRAYARSIDDVAPLADWLRGEGVEVVSRLDEIAPIQALNRSLGTILVVISGFATCGFVAALTAIGWSAIERKRRELALLALIGYGPGWLVLLPLLQAALLAVAGSGLAVLLFEAAAATIGLFFPAIGGAAGATCRLDLGQLLAIGGITTVLCIVASSVAATRVARIEPASLIRDG